MNNISLLETGKTDAQLARELRAELEAALESACEILDRAKTAGLIINFGIIPNELGRSRATISIVRPL